PQPHQYNFGSLGTGAVATTAITVTNVGDNSAGTAKLSIINVGITGDPDYTIVSKPASSDSILVGDSRQIVVRFSPIIDGIRTAGITIASNGKDSAVQNFAFTGIGLAPLISVDTNVLFKNKFVKMGDSLVARILISSTNTPTLFMTGYQFVGLDSGEYRISRYPSSNTIPGGTTDSIFITYKPTKEGRHVATLNLLNNSINNPVLPITLYGTAILPHIIVTPNPLRFDSVLMGVDSCKSIRIYNPGTDTLLIKANGLISNDGDFHYTPLTGLDTMIPPDKFKDVTICFKPLQKGTRVARLRFLTNIPKTFEQIPRDTAGQFLVDISGTGVPSSTLGQSIGFGEPSGWMDSVLIGKTICTDDSLTNTGDADLLINTITITGSNGAEYTYNGITLPFLLKAKSKIVIHLCATPGARGVRNGTLEIAGTMNEKPFTSKATLAVTGLLACAQASPNGLFLNTLIPISDSAVGMITLCDTVTNCGDIAAIYTATIGGNNAADYTVAPASSQTVLPGGTAVFCVTYKPTVSGNSPATLKISAADTPDQTVTLSGTAGCSELSAVIGGDSGPFGKGGHYTITVTITNNGNFDWVPDSGNPFLIGVDAGLLTQTGGTLDTIHPGGNVQLTFDFHPQDTMKAFSIPVGFVGGPCRDTTGVLLSGTTTNSGVRELSLQGFFLGMNHPNPFANATQFTYSTPTEASVTLSLHDVTGKLIRIISSGPVSAGEHTVVFNAGELSSGTYLLMLESGNIQLTHQVVIAK
ncbi:MAG TPA: choice-of-anchor D domain-containing protein, partial [Candidatus Kapabacteria bacterium]|nr:choice-of-anchor D domain-containing protein [Candidatus Kapabacteria bacterium]